MKITRKSDYGLRAMVELGKRHDDGPIPIAEVAAAQRVPDSFTEKIMQELKGAGLIRAVQGRGGGYTLAHDPETISVKAIIEALEGPVALVSCLDPSLECQIEEGCPTSGFWALINERFAEVLGQTQLADLLDEDDDAPAPESELEESVPR